MKKNNFPQNLKMLRKQYSMSMDELGNHINVSKQTISKYEKGLIDPNFHTLVAISSVFDCSLDNLVFGHVGKDTDNYNPNLLDLKNLIDTELSNLKKELYENIAFEINESKSEFFEFIDNFYIHKKLKSKD